jgi:hypothetical protein
MTARTLCQLNVHITPRRLSARLRVLEAPNPEMSSFFDPLGDSASATSRGHGDIPGRMSTLAQRCHYPAAGCAGHSGQPTAAARLKVARQAIERPETDKEGPSFSTGALSSLRGEI